MPIGSEGAVPAQGTLRTADPPKVTALINTYNYGRFIEETIESVLQQNFSPAEMEILVVDDGSTDDTAARVQKFAERVRYIRKENGGQASALNVGFAESRGEIIATLDGDDVWEAGKLAAVVAAFQKYPEAGMVYHHLELWSEEQAGGWPSSAISESVTQFPPSANDLRRHVLVPTSALAFRKDRVRRILPIPESLVIMADRYLAAVAPFAAPVVALKERLARYRVHGGNAFIFVRGSAERWLVARRLACEQAALGEILRWLEAHGIHHEDLAVAAYCEKLEQMQREAYLLLNGAGRVDFYRYLRDLERKEATERPFGYRVFRALSTAAAFVLGYRTYAALRAKYGESRKLMEWRERILPSTKAKS